MSGRVHLHCHSFSQPWEFQIGGQKLIIIHFITRLLLLLYYYFTYERNNNRSSKMIRFKTKMRKVVRMYVLLVLVLRSYSLYVVLITSYFCFLHLLFKCGHWLNMRMCWTHPEILFELGWGRYTRFVVLLFVSSWPISSDKCLHRGLRKIKHQCPRWWCFKLYHVYSFIVFI